MFACLSAALGIFSVSYFPRLPSLWLVMLLVFCLLLLLYYRRWILFLFVAGLLYGTVWGYYLLNRQLNPSLEGEIFIAEGVVTGLPTLTPESRRFHFRLHRLTALKGGKMEEPGLEAMVGEKVILSWYRHHQSNHSRSASHMPDLKTGDYWRLEVKLRRPRGFVNPAGFDYQLFLLQQQLMASGYVRNSSRNQWLGNHCRLWMADCWRQNLRSVYSRYQPDRPAVEKPGTGKQHTEKEVREKKNSEKPNLQEQTSGRSLGLLLGLLIGDRQAITEEQWRLLRNTGTIHLMAISGLHIGLAALIGFSIGKLLLRLWGLLGSQPGSFLLLRRIFPQKIVPRKKLAWLPSITSIILASAYSVLAGMTLPTRRALIMVVVFQWFLMNRRRIDPWALVSIALLAIALLDPLSIRSQGFWLSFLAVATLLFCFSGYQFANSNGRFHKVTRPARQLIRAQWVIALGLLVPATVLLQGVSLSSPLANLVAVPVVSALTVPLLFLSLAILPLSVDWSLIIFQWAGFTLDGLLYFLAWLDRAAPGFWVFDRGEIGLPALLFAVFGVVWLLSPGRPAARWPGLMCFLPMFFPDAGKPDLAVTIFDVGQGTAVVVETKNHQLVYDTGRRFSQRFNTGEHILAPRLLQQGYKNIDRLYLSHGDRDHAGGLPGLLAQLNVELKFSGEPEKTGGQACKAGQSWQWDDVDFQTLWPETLPEKLPSAMNSNNRSCVLLIRFGSHSVLLAGDIEQSVEARLLSSGGLPKEPGLLLVPHHGSKTSSHWAWVDALKPQWSVISAGYLNPYGHPHPVVVERYRRAGSEVLNTATSGAIRFTVNDRNAAKIEQWRFKKLRYWFDT